MESEELKDAVLTVIKNEKRGNFKNDDVTFFVKTKKECSKNRRCPHLFEFNYAIRDIVKKGVIIKGDNEYFIKS